VLFHITPNICRWTGVEDSLGDYLASLDRVNALPVERVLPAHRMEMGDLGGRVNELKSHHRLRLDSALEIVKREPGLTAYDIAGRMAWSIRCRSWLDFPVTQKFFAVGEALAHLDWLEKQGLLRREPQSGQIRWFSTDRES
jgi:glyoxylase-like metal-dependent hydrolase (beta-lactamase superfamily II)